MQRTINYNAGPTASQFHLSDKFIRGFMGPIGSGKSVSCVNELHRRAREQTPFQGRRLTRWAIIRNSYRELLDTSMVTFFEWVPKEWGKYHASDMKFTIEDETMKAEFLFRSLDRPDDIKKLLSLELTGAWINEARELPKPVFDMVQGRVGRYPPKWKGGASWFGVICDTNPPDEDHWWYKYFEEVMAPNSDIFKQPSGLSDEAENIENLPKGYYENLRAGKDEQWIDVYCRGKYGFVSDGKPIFPEYNDDIHTSKEVLEPDYETVYVGLDFGLTPAATFAQRKESNQQWRVLSEVVTEDMGAVRFAEQLRYHIHTEYPGRDVLIYGDPAGEQRAQTDESTVFQVLQANGINAMPASTNDFMLRREAVVKPLSRLTFDGQPGLLVSPKCRQLRKALNGGYKYKRLAVSGEERFHDKPDKNQYSHVAESLQYLFVGAGEGYAIIGGNIDDRPDRGDTLRELDRTTI